MISPQHDAEEVLPDDVPVEMPQLPLELFVTTPQQFKAIGDPTRSRILAIIRHRPATAKQLADTLKIPPGTIGHHLQVLEAAGLAQVVARRVTRGIIAKYYTRTARIFKFDFAPEVRGNTSVTLDIISTMRDEIVESVSAYGEDATASGEDHLCQVGFPHTRLSAERAQEYSQRLQALIHDFLNEPDDPHDPHRQVYGLGLALFLAPPYMQNDTKTHATTIDNPESMNG